MTVDYYESPSTALRLNIGLVAVSSLAELAVFSLAELAVSSLAELAGSGTNCSPALSLNYARGRRRPISPHISPYLPM